MSAPGTPSKPVAIPAPTGTRDLYPIELARRRFIEDQWRTVAIRHGFDEIDGPTFEHASLYAVKSGDGILGELFQTFSGKDEEGVKKMGAALAEGQRGPGGWKAEAMAPYALRPEFTPTLARMYAARAKQLSQPTKWFWQGPCFRAERPQRGRLREFWQWNCDIIGAPPSQPADGASTSPTRERGDTVSSASGSPVREHGAGDTAQLDAEIIAVCVELLARLGLTPNDVKVRFSHRAYIDGILSTTYGLQAAQFDTARTLLDQANKVSPEEFDRRAIATGIHADKVQWFSSFAGVRPLAGDKPWTTESDHITSLHHAFVAHGVSEWCVFHPSLARGLAYYTGMVFEVIVDGERAIAGGGRYDNLIELFGGPSTPAVGFGMGDVVLSLVLQDKKGPNGQPLMPSDRDIAAALGLRPDAFVISNGLPESDAQVAPLLASLRRAGLHARRSYKSTKNIGKLLKEGADAGARFAIIIENAGEATIKDLDTNQQRPDKVPLAGVPASIPAPPPHLPARR